ncbi:MAG: alpha/beta hydrolase [Bacteroidales bacterium]|nr:alpha/beta hydrolase [Bacteroidales bacterium]
MKYLLRISAALLCIFAVFSCTNTPPDDPAKPDPVKKTPRDTVIRLSIEGEQCAFANKAEYGIFVPATEEKLRGALILQHGCGMEQFGITRPYDLQYQAFAKKWNLAVVETALHGDCGVWKDPSSGSGYSLFKMLSTAGQKSSHPELSNAPLLIFGHSAGGYWSLAMLREYASRIIAVVTYSAAWDPQWDYTDNAVADVPVLLRHAGDNDGTPEILCPQTAVNHCAKLRKLDAPACVAFNEGQNHNFSYMRTISIPFFEAAMKQRLSDDGSKELKPIDAGNTWLGNPEDKTIFQESDYEGNKRSLYRFIDEATAKAWQEFVTTNQVEDTTPPPAPYSIIVTKSETSIKVEWKADADVESGIMCFEIYADGELVGRVPQEGYYQNYDTNGDNTYPTEPVPMEFTINGISAKKIGVVTVNRSGLKSTATTTKAR